MAADVLGQVPLVDDDDAALVLLGDLPGQALVHLGDRHGGVDEEPDHVGPLDALGYADRAVKLDIIGHLGLLADAGRVDQDQRLAVLFDPNVHGVAGGARDFADDHALRAADGIDRGAFAGVAFTHQGDFHDRLRRGPVGVVVFEPFEDGVEQDSLVEVVLG